MTSKFQINLIEKAARIAILAHANQKRKTEDLPYIIHPFMVALKLAKYNFPDEVIAAALTHDVLEDTDFDQENLKKELGDKVYKIVKAVTCDATLPWEQKKMKYIETVRLSSSGAKAVALADKIHNLESLLIAYQKFGKKIWDKFNATKEQKIWFENQFLKMIKETWRHPLIEEYEKLVGQLKKLD